MRIKPASIFIYCLVCFLLGNLFLVDSYAQRSQGDFAAPLVMGVSTASSQPKVGWEKISNELRRKNGQWLEKRLNDINKKAAALMVKQLERLDKLSRKLESRLKKMETSQPAFTKIYPQLENLKLDINNLKLQLTEQQNRFYQLEGVEENNLKWQSYQNQQNLSADLKLLRDKLITLRKNFNDILKLANL